MKSPVRATGIHPFLTMLSWTLLVPAAQAWTTTPSSLSLTRRANVAVSSPRHHPSYRLGVTAPPLATTTTITSVLLPPISRHKTGTRRIELHSTNANGDTVATGSSSSGAGAGGTGTGTATISNEVFNLVKSIVGAGVLTLPSGIAAFGNAPSAAIPAVALIAIFGILSGYGFALIGRVCALTGTTSYRTAWESSIAPSSSWIPALSCTLKTMFATLAYSMILGDTFTSLAMSAGIAASKTTILCSVTTLVLLPLCLLKNLSSLAPFSLLGSLGMVYTAVAMGIRYFGKAYSLSAKSSLVASVPMALRPAFGSNGAASVVSPVTAILLGMLSTSYMAHFNAPKFYTELKNNTVPRYLTVVSTAFACSIALFATIATLGFLTFGGNCAGLILNNYSTTDSLMNLSKIAVALSLVFSYPLAFSGARDGILDLFSIKNRSTGFLNALTVGILSSITVAALVIPDVSFVLAFAGATLGSALIYIFPGFMFRGAIQKVANPTRLQKTEVKIALSSAALGIVLGLLGAVKAVQSIL